MISRSRLLAVAALLLATSAWGGMFLVSKGVLQHLDPYWFTLLRYSLSVAFFAALLLVRGAAPWSKLRALALPLSLRGLAGFGVFSVLLLVGLSHSLPSHGAIIVATAPVTTQLLRWALDGVRPSRSMLGTAALALSGVVVVSGALSGGDAAGSTAFGDAVAFLGTLGWIVYTRGAARFPQLDVFDYTALTVIASWPLLLAGALLATALGLASPPSAADLGTSWQALLYVGLVSSAVAVLAYNFGVRSLGSVTATSFLNFVPVSALLMSLALGKRPSAHELAGLVMVGLALLLHARASMQAPAPARRPAGSGAASRAVCPAAR